MNRIVAAVLAVLYLGFSTGIAVNIHYCMDKIASVKIETAGTDNCGKCGAKTKPGCCKDELQILKVNDAHQLTAIDIHFHAPLAIISTPGFFAAAYQQNEKSNETLTNPPPLLSPSEIFIKNCVFRI